LKNTFERVLDAMVERRWSEVLLDERSGASLLTISSGLGDGGYAAEGLFGAEELRVMKLSPSNPPRTRCWRRFRSYGNEEAAEPRVCTRLRRYWVVAGFDRLQPPPQVGSFVAGVK
jgi:hypothetical protein